MGSIVVEHEPLVARLLDEEKSPKQEHLSMG